MMKVYEAPEIELIRFQTEDILLPSETHTLSEDETTPVFKNLF